MSLYLKVLSAQNSRQPLEIPGDDEVFGADANYDFPVLR